MLIKKMKIFKLIKGIGVASLLIMVSLESSIVNAATSNATRMEEDGYTLLDKKFDYQNVLQGKTMYAFGDSIVAGHKYPLSFVDFVTQNQGMKLTKYARNGAVICSAATDPMGGYIMNQVKSASLVNPDYVVFDGGTNDAENIYNNGGTSLYNIGIVTEGKDSSKFDTKTFAGSFEKTLYDMENKWHSAKIVYVAVHKLGSRDWKTQLAMREVELAACKKWGVIVADVFGNTNFDTRNIEMKDSYTFNNLNSSGVPGNNGSGTHPNLAGIKKYYLPVLTTTLLKLAISDISY